MAPGRGSVPWSDAPADLLWRIIERLPIADYIRFGAVCVSWRSALSENRRPPAAQVPFLLITDTENGVSLLRLSERREYHIKLPGTGRQCIGCSDGLLISINNSSEIHMFDPFSSTTRWISSLSLPNLAKVSSNMLLFNTRHVKVGKVLSTSPHATAAAIFTESRKLGFVKVHDCRGKVVNTWSLRDRQVDDIIVYNGRLYAATSSGTMVVFALSDLSQQGEVTVALPVETCVHVHIRRYLVESSGGDLLLVLRRMAHVAEGVNELTTTLFTVFKFTGSPGSPGDVANSSLQLDGFGDDAIFLGHNQTFALSTKDYPELRKNCIYFTDNHKMWENGYSKCDMGVYSMEDGSIHQCCSCEYQSGCPPVWFTPIATLAPRQQR